MIRADKPVLPVGGVGGENAEQVLRMLGAELRDIAIGLTDGETGSRRMWVLDLWQRVLETHPDLVTHRSDEQPASGYGIPIKFTVAEGTTDFRFDDLGYAGFAADSYATFKRLQVERVGRNDARFQVCIPFPEDVVRLCTPSAGDFEVLQPAYCDAVKREVGKVAAAIPADDLVIQWDVMWEVIAVETDDGGHEEPFGYRLNGRPLERFAGYLHDLSAAVPAEAHMGIHLCYGDFRHKHYMEPENLAVCATMATRALEATSHPLSYVHMPVPRDRSDDAYFEPLEDLALGATRLYIGLVHFTDGLEGSLQRLESFRRHYDGVAGVATECGMGRRPPDQNMRNLLRIHRELALRL